MVNYRCFVILLVMIHILVSICYLSVAFAQGKCLNFYSFESSTDSPKNDINWNMSNNNHHMGMRSLQSCGEARSEYKINVIGPVDISFWWTSSKGQDGIYFYQKDDGEIFPYTGTGWQKKTDSIPEGSHSLKWVFSKKRSQSISGWIDDICIAKKPCNEACPESDFTVNIAQNESLSTKIIDKPTESQKASTNDSSTSDEIAPSNFTKALSTACPLMPESTPIDESHKGVPQKITVIPCQDNGYDTCSIIQTAVDRVSPGGIVTVTNGDYYENLIINKPIKLVGVDKNKTRIIGENHDEQIINISADNVSLNNFSIVRGDIGIEVNNSYNTIIDNNIFEKNGFGIVISGCHDSFIQINNNSFLNNTLEGIRLYSSSGISVNSNRVIHARKFSIFVFDSFKNNIINNSFDSTDCECVYIWNSGYNNVNNNTFKGRYTCKIYLQDSENDEIESDMICSRRTCGDSGENCMCCN